MKRRTPADVVAEIYRDLAPEDARTVVRMLVEPKEVKTVNRTGRPRAADLGDVRDEIQRFLADSPGGAALSQALVAHLRHRGALAGAGESTVVRYVRRVVLAEPDAFERFAIRMRPGTAATVVRLRKAGPVTAGGMRRFAPRFPPDSGPVGG